MDSYRLFGFVCILRESLQVLLKSRKLMILIASFSLLLRSLLYLSNTFSITPFTSDLAFKAVFLPLSDPNSPEYSKSLHGIGEDIKVLLGIESLYVLASFIVTVFVSTATIFLSALTIREKNVTFKDLLSGVGKSWKRPMVTCFYTTLFGIVFIFGLAVIFGFGMATSVLIFNRPATSIAMHVALALGVLVWGFLLYLSVVWVLAVVVSVMEENCCGIQALRKAGDLIKGKRLDGFVLCLVLGLPSMIEIPVIRMMAAGNSLSALIITGLFVVICSGLTSMFQIINFTVLYFHCKKNHGEEIELQGSVEYSELATTPPKYLPNLLLKTYHEK